MKVCVAGSRFALPPAAYIKENNRRLWVVGHYQKEVTIIKDMLVSWGATEVVSGGCFNSPDTFGEIAAMELNLPIKIFSPDWDLHGKAAGPIRNREMAKYCDRVILMWDGKSRGSAIMKKEAVALGKDVLELMRDWRNE